MKAIPTRYRGYHFRSRLEARWAVFFDALGVLWDYEREGFEFSDGTRYLPDFWLPDLGLWAEIKGGDCSAADMAKIERLEAESGKAVLLLHEIADPETWSWESYGGGGWRGARLWVEADPGAVERLFGEVDQETYPKSWGRRLRCPACGHDYVSLGEIEGKNSDDYTAWSGRGSALFIEGSCEMGCGWIMRFGFHKGQEFFDVERVWRDVTDLRDLFRADEIKIALAFERARSARFEHGEVGAT